MPEAGYINVTDSELLNLARMAVAIGSQREPSHNEPSMSIVFRLRRMQTTLDSIYSASFWPETTTESGGRFAWAMRRAIEEALAGLPTEP